MAPTLEQATERLGAALERLERVAARRLDAERSRADLEIELQLVQDDRARLALELESSAARLERVDGARGHLERRVETAIGAVSQAMASLPQPTRTSPDPAEA